MDTSGRAMRMLPSTVKAFRLAAQRFSQDHIWISVLLMIAVLLLNGCAMKMQMGKAPMTDRLDQFTVNVSTAEEVISVLGEPQGKGAAMSPSFGSKEAWLYESTQLEGKTARMRMLMVFLDKNRRVYQGHLWFASGMLFGQTK